MLDDVQAFKNHLIASGYRPVTVELYVYYVSELSVISKESIDIVIMKHNHKVCKAALLKYLVDFKHLYAYDKYIKYEKFKVKPKPTGLSDEEFNKLLEFLSPRDALIAKLLRFSGFRVSEVIKDLHDDEKGLRLSYINANEINLKVKGGRWDVAELPFTLIDEVHEYASKRSIKDGELLFPIIQCTYWHALNKASNKAGMRHVYPHLLKHTTSRDCVERGMDLHETSIILHHASPDTTNKHYWRPDKKGIWKKKLGLSV